MEEGGGIACDAAGGVPQAARVSGRMDTISPKAVMDVFGSFCLMWADEAYMRRALALAERGRGWTSPNPMVGCVVTGSDGTILGEGHHAAAGGPHAEVRAFRDCRAPAPEHATVYVTLEPCNHHGRTPPCCDLFLEHPPKRIVIAMPDPNPRVRGGGALRLREAGIQVDMGVLRDEAERQNEAFIKHITTGRPFVTAKCAMTADGKIATRTGNSQWISGEAARRRTHELRHAHDAILVGSRTVMLDDPSLTTRLAEGSGRHPIRIVLDDQECLSADRAVFRNRHQAPTWVAATGNRNYPFADETLCLPGGTAGVDLHALLDVLGERNITSLLIEGGGTTLASAFAAGVVDKVCFFVAPKICGGRDAITPVEGEGISAMNEALSVEAMRAVFYGEDVLLEGYTHGRLPTYG